MFIDFNFLDGPSIARDSPSFLSALAQSSFHTQQQLLCNCGAKPAARFASDEAPLNIGLSRDEPGARKGEVGDSQWLVRVELQKYGKSKLLFHPRFRIWRLGSHIILQRCMVTPTKTQHKLLSVHCIQVLSPGLLVF